MSEKNNTALLTLFYTDYCGIPVVTVGLVMLISRIFDGSSDVIMGIIVSKTKSKWGKARPWILWMSVPYVLCAVAMFCVPHSSTMVQFWYIFVTYNLCTTVCYTAINVPYGTLSTMMTRSSHQRDLLSVVRMALSPIGKIIAVTFTMPVVKLFGNDQAAWIKTMSVWCAIALVLLVICFVRCKETVNFEAAQQEQPKVPVSRAIKALLGNPYFWATLILWTVTCVHTTIIGTDLPYYCKYVLGNDVNNAKIEELAASRGIAIIDVMDKSLKIGPSEFVWLISHSDLVCTDSFHASVFALLHHKPLAIFERVSTDADMSSRFDTLCSNFGLVGHRSSESSFGPKSIFGTDWDDVDSRLAMLRESSRNWLACALESVARD